MDTRKWFVSFFALLAILLLLASAVVQAQAPLPFNTAKDQAIRQQMVSTNNVWLAYLFKCAADPTGNWGIESRGTAAAYAYLYTGNPTYAANAWSAIQPYAQSGTLPSGNDDNSIRIYLGLYAICYSILRNTLAPADQQLYITWMNGVAQRARTDFLSSNANGLIGSYLGLCLWSLISAPDNPQASTLLTGTWNDSGTQKPYGGLDNDPTLSPRGSARNAIYDYVTRTCPTPTSGGVWLEGTQYFNASLEPLLLYTLAINEITGQDHFPEVTAALPQIGLATIGILTNDLADEFQFGDDEFPHNLHLADTLTTVTMLAYRLEGTDIGAELQWLVNYWASLYGYKDYACRMYLCMDPFAPATDFRSSTWPINGSGLSVWRSGWDTTSDSIFGVNTDPMSGVDHTQQDQVFRSIRLYRDGEWAMTHPITYGGMGCDQNGNNTVIAGGLGVMWQHSATAWEDGANYCYQRSETYGSPYNSSYFKPPPPYVSEQTGSVLYVNGLNKSADVMIVADRVNATDPTQVNGFPNGWRSNDATDIQNAETSVFPFGPLQWTLHMPVAPTIQNGMIGWDTAGGQHVFSQELTPDPTQTAFSLVDETAVDSSGNYLYFNYGSVPDSERKYQVRETLSDGNAWHFLLHALCVYNGSLPPAINEVDGNGVSGALVCPVGEAATLAVFSNNPAARLVDTGYTLSFTATNQETDLYLLDLDPALSWTIQTDNGQPFAPQFGSGGVVEVVLTGTGSHTLTLNNPAPTLNSLDPTAAITGSSDFTLTVNGSNLSSASTVNWNGMPLATTFVSSTQLTATVPASDIASAGTASVTVVTPAPGGGTSNTQTFAINNPVPATTSLSPGSAIVGSSNFTLTVNGSSFVNPSTVNWNGSPLVTTYLSPTQLTATVPASLIATIGTASVTVVTPAPGGGTSNTQPFAINNPVPTTTSLSPASAIAGSSDFTLTVNGNGFVSTSTVNWNGTALATTFVSASQLTATVPASDVASAGSASVTVVTPAPGGGASNTQTFAINNPVPMLSNIAPSSVTAGGTSFTLTANGSGFVNGATINWNGSPLATTFVSSAQLTASVPASLIANAGTASITVVNPAPGGGTSSAATLTINNPAPTLTLITPTSAKAGGAAFTLTVRGSQFVTTSTINWNGSPLATTYMSATQLKATVSSSLIATKGTANITVVNPSPGGGASNAIAFTIK